MRISDPSTQLCPRCGRSYSGTFKCIINGFYHDIMFVHMEFVRLPGTPYRIPAPRFCGPDLARHAEVDIDLVDQTVSITQ